MSSVITSHESQVMLNRPTTGSRFTDWYYTLAGKLLVPEWQRWYGSLDWDEAAARHTDPTVMYPDYYTCDRHGVKGGYLNGWQAIGWSFAANLFGMQAHYDHVARYLAARYRSHPPQRLLDIGSGTGDWAVQIAQQLPDAHLTALELSPYMLAAAERRWQLAELPEDHVSWVHGNGEAMPFADATFDVVTCFLLFHELTPAATTRLLRDARRVLAPQGRLIIFDAVQRPIPIKPVNDIGVVAVATLLREQDFATYAHVDIPKLAESVGFAGSSTTYLGRLPWQFHMTEIW